MLVLLVCSVVMGNRLSKIRISSVGRPAAIWTDDLVRTAGSRRMHVASGMEIFGEHMLIRGRIPADMMIVMMN